MTQHDAKNAVRHLKRQASNLWEICTNTGSTEDVLYAIISMREDIDTLLKQLDERKPATPNCRPATPEELEALCHSNHVVLFPAVA